MAEISKEEDTAMKKALDNLSRILGDIGVTEFNLIVDPEKHEYGFKNEFSNVIKLKKLIMFGQMIDAFNKMYEEEESGELILEEFEIDPSLKFVGIATKWYKENKKNISDLVSNTTTDYKPSEEDMNHPNLWKGEHWRWFLKTFMN